MIKKNDQIKLNIEGISAEGQGVARHDGQVIFIPYVIPGEEVLARVEKVNKNHAHARVLEVLRPSESRIAPDCSVFGRCGGCDFRHMDYAAELLAKGNIVSSALKRLGGISDEENCPAKIEVIPSPTLTGYRNKAVLPFGGEKGAVKLGFYAGRSHRLIPITRCPLCPEVFADIQKEILSFVNERGISAYDETAGEGVLRHLYLRRGEASGEVMVCFVVNGRGFDGEEELSQKLAEKFPEITGVIINRHDKPSNKNLGSSFRAVIGKDFLADELAGLSLRVGAEAFYQVNSGIAAVLYKEAPEMAELEDNERVLDLFCGIGAVGLFIAKMRPNAEVVGIDILGSAIEDARASAALNGLNNIKFIKADLSEGESLEEITEGYSAIFTDPPRKGLDRSTAEAIASAKPKKLVYISCDPATLSRDIKFFREAGFEFVKAKALDMFPRTRHVEIIALLRYQK